jgi:serine protease AprX
MSTPNKFLFLFLCVTFLAFTGPGDDQWLNKVDPVLLEKTGDGPVDFIVLLEDQADVTDARNLKTKEEKGQFVFAQLQRTAAETQPALWALIEEAEAPYRSFWVVNALWVSGDEALIQRLAQEETVAWITDNPTYQKDDVVITPDQLERGPNAIEWGVAKVKAPEVWAMGYTGQGVVVGGQDTGYEMAHPALQPRYRGYNGGAVDHNYSWHDAIHESNPIHNDPDPSDPANNPCGFDATAPCDDSGHGTHTMGTMVGLEGENQIGVAPDAQWIGARNMDRGYGTPATYIECFEWFLAPTDLNGENPDPTMAPHVIANSWSCPEMEGCNPGNFPVMQIAVDNLKASGVFVVVSAGNSGPSCETVNTPAAIFENSFTVGAIAQNDTIASFSSRGPVTVDGSGRMKPNISAPGVGVRSSTLGGNYGSASGTSMAGPHVAGVVALVISANPALAGQVDVLEDILENSSIPATSDQDCGDTVGSESPNNTYGHGNIDALAAVMEALNIAGINPPEDLDRLVEVFPNPFGAELNLRIKYWSGTARINLVDISGRQIWATNWTVSGEREEVLDLPPLAAGVYYYQIQLDDKLVTGKVVRQ